MSDLTTRMTSGVEGFFDWAYDHFPNATILAILALTFAVLASLVWGLFVVATAPQGTGWSVFFGGILFILVRVATWLYDRLFEVTLFGLLLIIVWYLAKLDLLMQTALKAGSLSFSRATAIRNAQYPVFSLKELIEAKELADEARTHAAQHYEQTAQLDEWKAGRKGTGLISASLFERLKEGMNLEILQEFYAWKYERMVDADLRVTTGKATIESEQQVVAAEASERDPFRIRNLEVVRERTLEWAIRVFGKDRVPS